MQWHQLHALSHSGFLRRDGAGTGCDLLLDMGTADGDLDSALRRHGSATARIGHLFVTHFDGDHYHADVAAAMARDGTIVYLARKEWEHGGGSAANESHRQLADTGNLRLLDSAGAMTLAGMAVAWATFRHRPNCGNLAYRVADHLFSGDTAVTTLLDSQSPEARTLLRLDGDPPRVLCINTAQRSRDDILDISDELGPARTQNYLENHGIAQDLIDAVGDPELRELFAGLKTIVPHHLRRPPLDETAEWIRSRLLTARDEQGFTFSVEYPGWRPALELGAGSPGGFALPIGSGAARVVAGVTSLLCALYTKMKR